MYIKKYWGNFIGGSDDSLNLVAFLEDQKKEEIPLSEIFTKIGLDKQNWGFRQTVEYLEFTHSSGVEMDFQCGVRHHQPDHRNKGELAYHAWTGAACLRRGSHMERRGV